MIQVNLKLKSHKSQYFTCVFFIQSNKSFNECEINLLYFKEYVDVKLEMNEQVYFSVCDS